MTKLIRSICFMGVAILFENSMAQNSRGYPDAKNLPPHVLAHGIGLMAAENQKYSVLKYDINSLQKEIAKDFRIKSDLIKSARNSGNDLKINIAKSEYDDWTSNVKNRIDLMKNWNCAVESIREAYQRENLGVINCISYVKEYGVRYKFELKVEKSKISIANLNKLDMIYFTVPLDRIYADTFHFDSGSEIRGEIAGVYVSKRKEEVSDNDILNLALAKAKNPTNGDWISRLSSITPGGISGVSSDALDDSNKILERFPSLRPLIEPLLTEKNK